MTLNLSPKTLIGLIAGFLLLVALFLRPGGTAETASAQLVDVARKTTGADAAPLPTPSAAPRRSWFAPEPESLPPEAPAIRPAPVTVPAGDPQPIYLDPPPTGADFPENNPR